LFLEVFFLSTADDPSPGLQYQPFFVASSPFQRVPVERTLCLTSKTDTPSSSNLVLVRIKGSGTRFLRTVCVSPRALSPIHQRVSPIADSRSCTFAVCTRDNQIYER